MKKILILSLIGLIIFTGAVIAEGNNEEEKTDFRSVSWGMNQEDVIQIEGTPEESSDNKLIYDIEISGVDLILAYEFIEDNLVKAQFANKENYLDDSHYYDDYKNLNSSLEQVHGEPDKKITNWDMEIFEAMYSEKMGFKIGVVEFSTRWEKERIKITHILTKEDILDSTHGFVYESLVSKHQELIESAEQEELEEQL